MFEGNTADSLTLAAQNDKLEQRFKLQDVVLVGHRGLVTSVMLGGVATYYSPVWGAFQTTRWQYDALGQVDDQVALGKVEEAVDGPRFEAAPGNDGADFLAVEQLVVAEDDDGLGEPAT